MTRWAVVFTDTPDMLEIRKNRDKRDAHVAYVRAHPELLIGGGLKLEPAANFCGALWIVEAENHADVVELIEGDPFYEPAFRHFDIYVWGKILEDQNTTL